MFNFHARSQRSALFSYALQTRRRSRCTRAAGSVTCFNMGRDVVTLSLWLPTGVTVSRYGRPTTDPPCPTVSQTLTRRCNALIMHRSLSIQPRVELSRERGNARNDSRSEMAKIAPRQPTRMPSWIFLEDIPEEAVPTPKLLPNALDCSHLCKRVARGNCTALLRGLPLASLGIRKTVIVLPTRDVGTAPRCSRAPLLEGEPSKFRATCQARCNLPRRAESCSGNRFCRPKVRSLANANGFSLYRSREPSHHRAASTSRRLNPLPSALSRASRRTRARACKRARVHVLRQHITCAVQMQAAVGGMRFGQSAGSTSSGGGTLLLLLGPAYGRACDRALPAGGCTPLVIHRRNVQPPPHPNVCSPTPFARPSAAGTSLAPDLSLRVAESASRRGTRGISANSMLAPVSRGRGMRGRIALRGRFAARRLNGGRQHGFRIKTIDCGKPIPAGRYGWMVLN